MKITFTPRHYLVILLLFVLCAVSYANALFGGFAFDDIALIVENPYIKDPALMSRVFKEDLFASAYENTRPNYYRPLQAASFILDYRLFRLKPIGYHATNILLHFFNSALVYVMLYLLFKNIFIAAFSSCLFCVHPMNSAAVAYISGRADLLAGFFILSVFLSAFALYKGRGQGKYIFLIVVFSLSALLSKENAMVIPMGILFLSLFAEKRPRASLFLAVVASLAAIAVYLFIRISLAGIPFAREDVLGLSPGLKAINFIFAAFYYVFLLLFPFNLHFMRAAAPILQISDARLWIVLAPSLLLAWLWYIKRHNRLLNFAIIWFILFIAPVFFVMTGFSGRLTLAEHWVYLASIGFSLALAGALFALKSRFKSAVYLLAAAALLAAASATASNNLNFKNRLALSKNILRYEPDNKEANKELAYAYLGQKKPVEARAYIDQALKSAPRDPQTYLLQGIYYEDSGDLGLAINSYEKALRLNPYFGRASNNLGAIYFNKGDLVRASGSFRRAIALNPILYEPYLNMARVSLKNNDTAEAVYFCEQAIRLNPDICEAYVTLARIFLEKQDFGRAQNILDRALAQGFRDARVYALSGVVSSQSGWQYKALRCFKEALRLDPKSEEAMLNLGVFYANNGQLDSAISIWRQALDYNPNNKSIRQNLDMARQLQDKNK
jgi:Tfp pilus assembly protein PilF